MRFGSRGVRLIKKFWATRRAGRRKPGFIFITRPIHTIRTTALGHGVPGLLMVPRQVIAWDILEWVARGDTLGSESRAEICITMAAGHSCFSEALSTTRSIGRTC